LPGIATGPNYRTLRFGSVPPLLVARSIRPFCGWLFATRAEADEERRKLTRTLYRKVSPGVAAVEE
jgi:hypothetical protein